MKIIFFANDLLHPIITKRCLVYLFNIAVINKLMMENEYEEEEGVFLASGSAGPFTVIWFMLCAGFLTWLFVNGAT